MLYSGDVDKMAAGYQQDCIDEEESIYEDDETISAEQLAWNEAASQLDWRDEWQQWH